MSSETCNVEDEDFPITVILEPRNQTIADLIELCATKKLPFSGPDSLCSKVLAMGYSINGLYEMVIAAEYNNGEVPPPIVKIIR